MRILLVLLLLFLNVSSFARVSRQVILNSPGYIGGAGLFHNFHIVVGLLDAYDKNPENGLVVDFGTEGLYFQDGYGSNWWKYYFEPIDLKPKTYTRKRLIAKYIDDVEKAYYGNSVLFFFSRNRANQLITKYISLKKYLKKEIDSFFSEKVKNEYVIGVHYRSSDKNFEAPFVPIENLAREVKKHIKKIPTKNYTIFLATDNKSALEFFKFQFRDRLVFQNSFYSKGDKGAHYIYRGYESGKRAVIDCYLLSRCNVLIRTSSNLSAASAYINPLIKVINMNSIYTGKAFLDIDSSKFNELNKVTRS